MDRSSPRLRFAITTQQGKIPRWGRHCLRQILGTGVSRLIAAIEVGHEGRVRVTALGTALQAVGLEGLGGCPLTIAGTVSAQADGRFELDPGCLTELAALDLDFVLDFSLQPLTGAILGIPRFGVWWMRSDDSHPRRLPCARPVLCSEATTGLSLVRLGPESALVLFRGVTRTAKSVPLNLELAFRCAIEWPARAVRLAARTGALPTDCESVPVWGPLSPVTRWGLGSAIRRRLRRLAGLWGVYFTQSAWNIGIVRRPMASFLTDPSPPVEWLPNPRRDTYLADPFGIVTPSGLALLAEEYQLCAGRGRLVAIRDLDATGPKQRRDLPAFPCHVSYPFVFCDGTETYCVPETHEAREVVLYRIDTESWRWERVTTILSGVPLVDATIFPHDGLWYMLGTTKDVDSETTLLGWWALRPAGPWQPHLANPIRSDVRSSRPAGTPFVHEGRLFRPAQDCSRCYGGAVVIHEIERLSPTEYRERPVQRVAPDRRGPYPHGLHTLSAVGDVTLIDGLRSTFRPQWELIRRAVMGRLFGTLRPALRRLTTIVRRLPLVRPRVLR
ncbi:MAG: hypothetical protein AB7I09_01625 [Planctomycetota bacterium]